MSATPLQPAASLSRELQTAALDLRDFRAMGAFGRILCALADAAAVGVTLDSEHAQTLHGMLAFFGDAWPSSLPQGAPASPASHDGASHEQR